MIIYVILTVLLIIISIYFYVVFIIYLEDRFNLSKFTVFFSLISLSILLGTLIIKGV